MNLTRPGKIVCVGRNYPAHAREMGNEVPKVPLHLPQAAHGGDRTWRPDRPSARIRAGGIRGGDRCRDRVDQVIVSGKEAMQAIRAYYTEHPRVLAEVDIDEAEEIAYQQTEQAAVTTELDQFLGEKKPIPDVHFLKDKRLRGKFYAELATLGYQHDEACEMRGYDSLYELPPVYNDAWALVQSEHSKQR